MNLIEQMRLADANRVNLILWFSLEDTEDINLEDTGFLTSLVKLVSARVILFLILWFNLVLTFFKEVVWDSWFL